MDSVISSRGQLHPPRPWRWWSIALASLMLDLGSKLAVDILMPYGHSIPLTPFFNLIHTGNTGAAFSFLANVGGWQRYFFIVLAVTISAWLANALRKPLPRVQG